MAAFFSSILASLIPRLLQWLWNIADEGIKAQLAHAAVEKHVKETIAKYEQLVIKYDDLAEQKGGLSDVDKEELRLKKIQLETDILNNIGKH